MCSGWLGRIPKIDGKNEWQTCSDCRVGLYFCHDLEIFFFFLLEMIWQLPMWNV
jgi:hypothetical protein